MRSLRSMPIVFALFLCGPVCAGDLRDLIGVWIIQPPSPPGVVALTTVTFRSGGDGIIGEFKLFGYEDAGVNISDINMAGDLFSFKVSSLSSLWKGRFDNKNELQMELFAVDKNNEVFPVTTRIFRRSSSAELSALRANLPKTLTFRKVSLPPLRNLTWNGLARTPPMGWSSWNQFMENINETVVRETADALVSSGLRDVGYTLVEVDDGWQGRRDDKGVLHSNSKFPDMRALIDYVHSKGLQFGIYTTPGPISCAGYVGSHGYENEDAQTFARWGVDFVMNDACSATSIYHTTEELQALHQKMAEALRATGRPIMYKVHDVFNTSNLNISDAFVPDSKSWGRKVGANLWRTGDDLFIGDRWKSVSSRFERHGQPENSGPGGWNDADNLVIGLGGATREYSGLTREESRTHMTLWSMLASPLILGNDIRSMSDDVKAILLNKEVITVDQDALGKQGQRAWCIGSTEIWIKPLSDGSAAVAAFNRADEAVQTSVNWGDLHLRADQTVRDLWQHTDLGRRHGSYSALLPAHGSLLLRVQEYEAQNVRR
jgi:alpha-galactosidase